MFEWIFYPWMISNAYTLPIIYARVYVTPIYSMLVLFTCCWGSDSSIQAEVGNLNGDLLHLSGIRYKVWSFSVRYLVSFSYRKGFIFGVKLSIVVPQDIGISLHNNYHHHLISSGKALKHKRKFRGTMRGFPMSPKQHLHSLYANSPLAQRWYP